VVAPFSSEPGRVALSSDQAVTAAQRAVEVAEGLADKLDFPARAAASLRRAEELARQEQ
jgi:hypothetical protein